MCVKGCLISFKNCKFCFFSDKKGFMFYVVLTLGLIVQGVPKKCSHVCEAINSPKYGTRNKSRVIFEILRSSSHMSAEPKWCFLNYPKGGTYIFQLRTTQWFRVYVSSNQIHLLFGIFAQKIDQKGLKTGLKCLGLVWFGLIWLGCDPGSWQYPNFFSICQKKTNLKVWIPGVWEEL